MTSGMIRQTKAFYKPAIVEEDDCLPLSPLMIPDSMFDPSKPPIDSLYFALLQKHHSLLKQFTNRDFDSLSPLPLLLLDDFEQINNKVVVDKTAVDEIEEIIVGETAIDEIKEIVVGEDNQGRFAKRRVLNELPASKRQKKNPDTKKYVAAGEFLLSKRYLIPDDQRRCADDLRFVSMDEAVDNVEEYLKACVKLEVCSRHRNLENYINQGKAIDFFFRIARAEKKQSAVELYRQLGMQMQMPGADDVNTRWFQGRRAIASIADILDLDRYGYNCSPSELVSLAPKISRAHKLKLVNFE
jgi:hypothetical protein